MLSSQRSSKPPTYPEDLAAWLELDYHRRLRPLRGRRKWVTMVFFSVAVLAVGLTLLPGKQAAYEAAPVSQAHALFGSDCNKCHVEPWQPVKRLFHGDTIRSVSDAKCLECHDSAAHEPPEAPAADCATCHHEHRGKDRLARVADGFCTACHADIQRVRPASNLAAVTAFAVDHPEFALLKHPDKGSERIRFNHASHLGLDLKALHEKRGPAGLENLGDHLECSACHQPDSARRYMRPIHYEEHCARCHGLWVPLAGRFEDDRTRAAAQAFRQRPALHTTPELVRADLRERYLRFAKENPVVLSKTPADEPRRPVPGDTRAVTEMQWLWAKGQVSDAEEKLFSKHQLPAGERLWFDAGAGCSHCHQEITDPRQRPGGLPVYQKANIPARWFVKHSFFSHDSHRMLQCLECHGGATREGPTRLLLPSVDSCKNCHAPAAGARSDCALCHMFHDHAKERYFDGSLKIAVFGSNR